jgi:hypothetical protein
MGADRGVIKENSMKGWYFSNSDKRLSHGDGRIIKIGRTHKVDGEIEMYKNGLHASQDILDAVAYAQGSIIWRVELSGTIIKGFDKIVASKRTYLSGGIDISETLHKFARMCALDVVHLWDAPDVVKEYLRTGNESLRSAANSTANSASYPSAHCEAYLAAHCATNWAFYSAARSAAYLAARSAANAVATSADNSEVHKRQSKRLYKMVMRKVKK